MGGRGAEGEGIKKVKNEKEDSPVLFLTAF